ncbi:MAG: hypothetical protein ACPGLV_12400 [Bacteroidia bacterium]
MKTNKLIIVLGLLCLSIATKAQTIYDVQRYSSNFFQSDARSMAVGNAFGALGSNTISSSINPAGLAAFPVSSFTMGLGYAKTATNALYLDNSYTEDKYNLNLSNIGIVLTDQKSEKQIDATGWINSAFAITVSRRNNFSQDFLFQGVNTDNTVLDRFSEEMDYVWFNDLAIDSTTYGGMAYYAHLIDPYYDADDNLVGFTPSISNENIEMQQRQSFRTRGAINDINFSFASNYQGMFMIGGTLGVPVLNYEENGTFEEQNLNYLDDNYNSMSLRHRIHDQGVGIFGQIGVIFKPIHAIRLGASIKTPTFYSINRDFRVWWNSDADSRTANIEPRGYDYNYNLTTPWNANLSAAFVIKNLGFISADYTYFDGSMAKLKGTDENAGIEYLDQNMEIQKGLSAVHQVRLGGEYVFGPFALRAGQTITTSAYNQGYMPDNDMYFTTTSSAGLGYREAKFFLDFGYQISNRSTWFQPYGLSTVDVEGANLSEKFSTLNMTIGFNF